MWTMNGICGSWDSWSRLLSGNFVGEQEKEGTVAWEGTRVKQRGDPDMFTDCLGRGSLEAFVGSREGITGEIRQGREEEMGEAAQAERKEKVKQRGNSCFEESLLKNLTQLSFNFCMPFFVYTKELVAGCLYCRCLGRKAKHILTWWHGNTDWRIIVPFLLFFLFAHSTRSCK